MIKSAVLALVASAATLGSGAAQAGNVSWSIGISTPVVGTVISNLPVHPVAYMPPARVYLPAPPIVQAPVPVYVPAPVYYPRQGVYYRPVPVAHVRYAPGWGYAHGRWDNHHGGHGGHGGHHD